MGVQSYGVAPFWVDTSDTDYDVPTDYTGVGLMATSGGTITIVGGGGTVEITLQDGVPFPAHFRSLDFTGATATGVLAAIIQ